MTPRSARPLLKWAGGKSRCLPDILALLPDSIGTYYEPFVGGAAVFFALAAKGRFKKAVLGDRNPDLVDVYRGVKTNVEAVIKELRRYRYDRDEFYKIRALDPKTLDLPERAARVIYLNKTGYNGLYRVNSKGEFNVPFGRHKNPTICDEDGLRLAAAALKNAKLKVGDFKDTCCTAERGDAVYFDPPYYPISETANFTAYDKNAFGRSEHEALAETFSTLARQGVSVVLSNSSTSFTRKLFNGHAVRRIDVTRPINSKSSARGPVAEILVSTRRA
jgi:DNA adenine methylase